jgi:UDP-glucose 4-epimerase
MTILITGGAGYIGSHMTHMLADAGERVVVLDNLSTGFARLIPAHVPFIVGDCGNSDLLVKLISEHAVHAIIHLAGSVVVSESVEHPLRYYRNNTANTRTVMEAAIHARVTHFIFSSTATVYGHPEQIPLTEEALTGPISPYGRSKLMSELMLADAGIAHDLKFIVLRYFNVAGADPRMRTGQSARAATHLIKLAVQTALGLRPKLHVFGTDYPTPDGTCIRDYIHVADLVQAHIDALHYLRRGGNSVTLNCGYGHGASVYDVIKAVKRVSGQDFRVEQAPRRAGDTPVLVASSARVRALLGWRPQFDNLDLIVGHALEWEKTLLQYDKSIG